MLHDRDGGRRFAAQCKKPRRDFVGMGEPQEDLTQGEEDEDGSCGAGNGDGASSLPYVPSPYPPHRPGLLPGGRERLHIQKSNVCSRAYFVVVMVFFHVYILNVIALLLYVHYNNGPGPGDLVPGDEASGGPSSPVLPHSSAPPPDPDLLDLEKRYRQGYSLPRVEGIRVGHVQRVSLMPDRTHEMKTLSLKPLLFEVPGFLSEEECRVVVQLAQLKGLMESQTPAPGEGEQHDADQPLLALTPDEVFSLLDLDQDGLLQRQEIVSHSRAQDGTWLSPDNLRQILTGLEAQQAGALTLEAFQRVFGGFKHPAKQRTSTLQSHFQRRSKHTRLYQGPGSHHVLHTLRSRITRLARLPSPLVELSEPLQVIRYERGGFSDAHHDSSPAHSETTCAHTRLAGNTSALTEITCRYLTVMFYLNAVTEGGETTFPVADNRTYEEEALIQDGKDLTDTRSTCERGNLRVKPTTGTALLWYNHLSDGRGWMGEVDEYSLHGGCPVTRGEKWVANSWVNVDPDHQRQARYQRLVTHGQQAKPGREEHYHPLSHSELHQDL